MFENRDFLPQICIGTLWEDEQLEKNHGYNDRWARDDKGHKRWHGAWTGGFEAGYRNTVGSEQGWTPSQFVSSRSKRNTIKEQNILDFMDDEDLGKNVAGVNIVAKTGFESASISNAPGQRFGLSSTMSKPLEEFFGDNKNSIGFKIVENMKKKIDVRERRSMIEEGKNKELTDTKDYLKISDIKKIKKDHKGLGFDKFGSYVYLDYEDQLEENFNKIMKGLIEKVDGAKAEESKGSNRIGFAELGGGVKDSEIYSKYEVDVDKNAAPKEEKKLSQRKFRSSDFLQHFKQHKTVPKDNIYDAETKKIPKDFDPYWKVKEFLNSEQQQKQRRTEQRRTLSVRERALLLKEDFQVAEQSSNPKLALKTQSFINKLSDQSKKLLSASNRFIQTNKKPTDVDYTPTEQVYEDRLKNERYHFFKLKQRKLYKGEIRYPLGFRASQINQELSEFANMYSEREKGQEQNPIAETQEEKKTEKEKLLFKIEEMREKIEMRKKKRVIEDWIPNRVLCIRFKVQQPRKKGVLRKPKKFDFEKDIMPVIQRDLREGSRKKIMEERELEKRMEEEEQKLRDEGVVMPDENQIDFVKPEKDLFDSIFNNDDSDED